MRGEPYFERTHSQVFSSKQCTPSLCSRRIAIVTKSRNLKPQIILQHCESPERLAISFADLVPVMQEQANAGNSPSASCEKQGAKQVQRDRQLTVCSRPGDVYKRLGPSGLGLRVFWACSSAGFFQDAMVLLYLHVYGLVLDPEHRSKSRAVSSGPWVTRGLRARQVCEHVIFC